MTFAEKTEEAQGMRLHVDRGVLRDIIEARIASDKRRSYYTIGSVFSAMGFTLVALGSTNYTASSLFVLIGIFYYLCIVGVNVNYVDEEGTEEEVAGGEKGDVYAMTREEKLELVRTFIEELSGFEMTEEDIERIVWPAYNEAEDEADESQADQAQADQVQADQAQADDVDVQVERAELEIQPEPVAENEIVVEEGDQDDGPRLARAETSYSEGVVTETQTQTEVESAAPVLAEAPAEAQEAAPVEAPAPPLEPVEAPVQEESETKNNVEDEPGSATPEASGASA
jgi:hypothetical protein